MHSLRPFTYLGDYINGTFVIPKEKSQTFESLNPGNLKDTLSTFHTSFSHVRLATEAAKSAFPKWRALSQEERATYLKKFYKEIEAHLY